MIGEVFEIFTDPAHLVAEFVFEFVFMVITLLINWWALKRRNRKHGHDS
jgi:hypothetical protein